MLSGIKKALSVVLLGICLSSFLLSADAYAEYQELDAIVAIVEDDVVLASELRTRFQQVKSSLESQSRQMPPTEILISQIMERLIIESLQHQEAERRGVVIDDETLTRAVIGFAEQNNMTLEQFEQALIEDGTSYRQFREEIRGEIMINRLQRNLINRRITISEQDVQGLLNSPFYKEMFSDEYRIGHILLSIEAGANEAAVIEAAARGAEIIESLRGGADFAKMAIENSSASTALEGGDLGLRKAAELPSLFAETVIEMEVGDVADPIQTAGAIHIIKLLERKGAGTQRQQQTLVRHILVQPSEIRSEEETEALIRSIESQLNEGAEFAELAEEYSEDPSSALNGGSLGWTTGREFVPQFAENDEQDPQRWEKRTV